LVRGVGPTLSHYDVSGVLVSPQLALYDSTGNVIATDIGWNNGLLPGPSIIQAQTQQATTASFDQVDAFPLPMGSADCAMVATLPAGSYTAQVSGVNNTTGVALAELYDADTGTPASNLVNISARAFVGAGSQVLVGGFVVSGATSETVLIRAVGPTLSKYGVTGVLAQPQLTLYDSTGAVIATNTGWSTASVPGASNVQVGIQPASIATFNQVYAFALPAGSADCAMVVNLPPGAYTAQVTSLGGVSGVSLIEVYDVP